MRPTRPFQDLLREALAAVREGRLEDLRGDFREEAEQHARLGLRGKDPVAQALALGREALGHLARREIGEACEKLRQALKLHAFLGGGLAWELAEALCGKEAFPEGREGLASLEEVPSEARLLAFLDRLPTEFWVEVLRGPPRTVSSSKPKEARASSRPRLHRDDPPRSPGPTLSRSRPRIPFAYRPLTGQGPQGEGKVMWAGLVQANLQLSEKDRPFRPKQLRRWVAPGLEVREVRERLYLRVLPEFWKVYPQAALLVLEAGSARALVPLLPTRPSQPLPVDPEGGADLVAEVWSWEDLTGEALAELLREGRFHLDLLRAWLRYGEMGGRISREVVLDVLKRLEEGS